MSNILRSEALKCLQMFLNNSAKIKERNGARRKTCEC